MEIEIMESQIRFDLHGVEFAVEIAGYWMNQTSTATIMLGPSF